MAQCVVPPRAAIVECNKCGTLYVPDRTKDRIWSCSKSFASFEKCPVCGYDDNDYDDTISLWKYNLISFFRKHFRREKG